MLAYLALEQAKTGTSDTDHPSSAEACEEPSLHLHGMCSALIKKIIKVFSGFLKEAIQAIATLQTARKLLRCVVAIMKAQITKKTRYFSVCHANTFL